MDIHAGEALRYLGAGTAAPEELRRDVAAAMEQLTAALRPRYTYRVFSLQKEDEGFRLLEAGMLLTGQTAGKMLAQCNQAVLLACTLGVEFDALLRAEQARDMSRAVILNACGSAFVESGCDTAEKEIAARFSNLYLTDRFSPGYGDLPLSLQPGLCAALDAQRRIGVHVTESCLLNPAKSVTAVIGLADKPQMARVRGCACCSLRESCTLRKGGASCAI